MNILGLNILNHDTSATLIKNDKIIGMVEEERFTRKKHEKTFPENSIEYLLNEGNLKSEDIDIITIPYAPWRGFINLLKYCSKDIGKYLLFFFKYLIRELTFKKKVSKIIRDGFLRKNLKLKKECKFFFFEHHLCHAASTYYSSSYKESVILSWDGRGQWAWLLTAIGKNNKIEITKKEYIPNSLGQLYESFTHFLGFNSYGDEYKVMGLSSYGKNKYSKLFDEIVCLKNLRVKINPLKWKFVATGSKRKELYEINLEELAKFKINKNNSISKVHMDIAHGLQKKINDISLEITKNLFNSNKIKNLCIAGGIGQNILINQNIYLFSGFKNVYVQPASHDGGLSLGGALLAYNKRKNKKILMEHAYWGPQYNDKEIYSELMNHKIKFRKVKNVTKETAKIIKNGKIIGWFQGRSEFGPRALGNRSILADPRKVYMKNKVNKIIKFREIFRPFAPSVLEEDFEKYFYNSPKNQFMTFSADVKNNMRKVIPAVTHVDGTARPQTVYKKNSFLYWKLLKEFKKLTGVGVLLNTSFNVKGEPIVNSPKDAIKCFLLSGLDNLIIGDYLISK